jgi:hypothetical protein
MSSQDFGDKFLSPDLIARKPYEQLNRYMWGKGERVIDWNSTESLVSALIMRGYVEPSSFISPVDVNPYVGAKGQIEESGGTPVPYDYACWDPVNACNDINSNPHGFWDTSIYCDLAPNRDDDTDHNSYANSTLCGKRLKKWNANSGYDHICWSTRGTKMGAMVGTPDYDNSFALEMVGDYGRWKGHMAHADGSVSLETSFFPVDHYSSDRGRSVADNVFDAEFQDEYFVSGKGQSFGAGDNFLTYSNNAYASGSPVAIFPASQAIDDVAIARCTWDTDADW